MQNTLQRRIVDFDTVFTKQVALIEWPDKLGWIPETRLLVEFEYPQVQQSDKSDPWGFGDGDDPGRGRDGRIVSLQPVGGTWGERVKSILRQSSILDHGDRLVVRDA